MGGTANQRMSMGASYAAFENAETVELRTTVFDRIRSTTVTSALWVRRRLECPMRVCKLPAVGPESPQREPQFPASADADGRRTDQLSYRFHAIPG